MVDISSQNNKKNVTVTSNGNTANVNATPDIARYYSDKSKEWAISNKIVDNEDYSSKYYANESKKQADISTAKATEVIESGNTAVSNIESTRDNAITDITNQENLSIDNVNTAGATQVALATEQANIATQQATIATNKTSEVMASGNEALSNIDTAKTNALTDITDLKNTSISSMDTAKNEALTEIETLHSSSVTDITSLKNTSISNITTAKDNAITSITNQETTSKNVLIDEGATQVGLIQNEGATQVANVQSTGFYMRDDKLYYINSQGEETEFKLNDIELNNPYSLFDSKYSDHELNNISWLQSSGQWNSGAVYVDAYDKLLKVYNGTETVEGLSVKLSTETYTDYDFVLNTADETFRLPLLDGSESVVSSKYIDLEVPANGSAVTAPANGWIWMRSDKRTSTGAYYMGLYGSVSDYASTTSADSISSDLTVTVPVNRNQKVYVYQNVKDVSDPFYFRFTYAQGNGSLYFYVGETVQNANLIDAGRIGEQLASKVDVSNTQWAINAYMPDYSAGVSIGLRLSSNPYTAPSAGIISVDNLGQNQTEIRTYLVINGIKTNLGINSASSYTTINSFIFPVNVGDVCYFSASLPVNSVYFYPLKGGN